MTIVWEKSGLETNRNLGETRGKWHLGQTVSNKPDMSIADDNGARTNKNAVQGKWF